MKKELEFIRDEDKSYTILDEGIKYYGRQTMFAFELFNLRTSNSLTIFNDNTDSFRKYLTFDAKFVKYGETVSFFGHENIIQKYEVFILAVKGAVEDECVVVPQEKGELTDEDTLVFQCNLSESRYDDLVNKIKNAKAVKFFCTPKGGFYAVYSHDPFYEKYTQYKVADWSNKRKVLNPKKLKKFEEFWVEAKEVSEFTFQFIENIDIEDRSKNYNIITSDEETLNTNNENQKLNNKIIDENKNLNNQVKNLENIIQRLNIEKLNIEKLNTDHIQSFKNNDNINFKRIEQSFGLVLSILIILIVLIIFKII